MTNPTDPPLSAAVLRRRIRWLLAFFMLALLASGLTAFPLLAEMELLARGLGIPPQANPADFTGLQHWIALVRTGLRDTDARYPFIAYGTDWLAFAHIILAVLFLGPWRDPVRNVWVIHFGLFACVAVIPLALICGHIREIPFSWRLLDCSFGIFGFIPLRLVRRYTRQLSAI